jgi:alpha-glucosidase (family GH31 glycosyl hydrolase)
MSKHIPRRNVLKLLGAGAAATWIGRPLLLATDQDVRIAGKLTRISVLPLGEHSIRITISEQANGAVDPALDDGVIIPTAASASETKAQRTQNSAGNSLQVHVTQSPLTIQIENRAHRTIQLLKIDEQIGSVNFQLGTGPILGMGEGGPQFDRRGNADRMRSGQGGYRLRTNGGRVPVQWLIGTSGWAMFIHHPLGSFDLTGPEGIFHPPAPEAALPFDIFVVDAADPAVAMREYARITGYPEMPPLWSLGYQQSHRTLAGQDEILGIANTFREKKLPCDALIYLGTGFCPSGWNTDNGSFQFNPQVFPDPKGMLEHFHEMNFRIVLHDVILSRTLRGTVHDACSLARYDAEQVGCYWEAHRKDFALGVDGWWPDEGDPLDGPSRLARIRMFYEGPQLDRPNERPFALHRNGYPGMQRYAPFLWSGDVYSTWETLRTHVPVGINTGLTGIPFWGADTGGFVPTKELTGELFARWFQFSAFCPLFRSHGRDWKLRLPWGWNTGELGPNEISTYGDAANPDPGEFHNPDVEPICRKYLELRYRLLPYLYTAVREAHDTGLPVMRALWLHYPDDPAAVARGDEYLYGREILVAPVTEKGATSRTVYLPSGDWYDFWTEEKHAGGREVQRAVDLGTMPLYVRAGSILPLGPVKQYTSEKVDDPLTLVIYPGADATYILYEDDGKSFAYRRGEWTKTEAKWTNSTRKISLHNVGDSKSLYKLRNIEIRIAGETKSQSVQFAGRTIEIQL